MATISRIRILFFSEIADVSLLNYEREATRFYENFDLCEGAALRNYADRCEERKTLVDLFSPSFLDENEVDFSELERLMQTRGIESVYNDGAKTASFSLKQYFGGKNKEAIAKFPTPENTKAKLELLGELGYMGVSFDIERSPVSSLVAFNSFFQREKAIKVRRERCNDQPSAPI